MYVDRDMWEKIVLNLLSNAFKFTLDGQIARRAAARRAMHAVLTVRDTGSGIPADELPRVFERFHRVEGTRGRTHEGTGIGLALVQELVKLHGGSVGRAERARPRRARSPSRFRSARRISPPMARDRGAEQRRRYELARATRSSTRPCAGCPSSEPGDDLSTLAAGATTVAQPDGDLPPGATRILLADDNADMREYVRRLLGAAWDVEAVRNGARGAGAAQAQRPRSRGHRRDDAGARRLRAAARAARRRAATRDVPVMMLSARAGEESRVEGLQAGADDYLVKPFSARELVARVETQMLRGRVRSIEDAQRRRLRDIFAQAPAAIAILRGPDHVFEMANPWYR